MYMSIKYQATRSWSELPTKMAGSEILFGHFAHMCTLNGPTMYVQGGICVLGRDDLRWQDVRPNVYSLNLDTLVWRMEEPVKELDLQEMPLDRTFHSGVYVKSRIIIFGGESMFV